ncbi:MAG TPA: hypothetical protein VGD42_22990 [Lysobacter sp.]
MGLPLVRSAATHGLLQADRAAPKVKAELVELIKALIEEEPLFG